MISRLRIVAQRLDDIKTCLADPAHRNPIAFGVLLFDSFESDGVLSTGVVPMPDLNAESMLGGHAIVIVGYDDTRQMFEIMNSWGPSVGDGGYFWFPYQYILNTRLTSDFHTMYKTTTVTSVPVGAGVVSVPTASTPAKPVGMYKLNISQHDSMYSNNVRSSSLSSIASVPQRAAVPARNLVLRKAPNVPKLHHALKSVPKIIVRQ